MVSATTLLVPFILGSLIGLLYFSGLWQMVQRLPDARTPLRILLFSYVGRMTMTLGGFYVIMDGTWERLAAAMAGFLILRIFLVRRFGRTPDPSPKGALSWKS
ncbi:MAG: ATP synthase subunit I [Syntrophales bacterium]